MSLRVTVLIVFVVALAIRLVALAGYLPKLKTDADLDSYRSLARSLVAGKGFVAPALDGRELPSVSRTPVYPIFLAALMHLGGDRLGVFLAVQCVLGAVTCALTALVAARSLSSRAAGIAGLLVAIDPNSVVRCVDLRTETLFTLLLVAGACVFAWRAERFWAWLVCGTLWSLAALTRPIAVWLWVVAAAVGVAQHLHFRHWVAFLIGYLVLLGVWGMRNHALTGHYFVSTIATYNALMYRAAGVEAAVSGASLEAVQKEFRERYGDVQFYDNRERFEQTLRTYKRVTVEKLSSAPVTVVRQTAVGWGKLLLGPGARALDNALREPKPAARWWPPIYTVALAGAVLLSVVGARRLGREAILPAALVLYFVVLAGGPESNSRFRVPITPTLAILAVAGCVERRKK